MSIRTCRLCLNEDSFTLNLFGDESRCRNVLHKIKFCIPIVKISKNDSNPKHICFKCLSTLEIIFKFLKKCAASESIMTRSSQFPPDEVMNYSTYSSHSHTGKYRWSASNSSSSSKESTPDWAKVTKAKSPCFQKQPDRAPMQESDAKKRKADTFPSRSTPGSFIHPPTSGGGVEVGKKPVIQQRANTANCYDIFSSFIQGDEDEDENGKFLTNFWKDMPVKPQAKSMTQPDKDCSFQIPRSSGSDNSATKKDTKATVGPPNKASQILGHIMDNWKPAGKSPCFQKQPDRAPMQESDAKKRKASPSKDTFPSRSTPGSFIHPPTFGGGVEVGKKPVIQQKANTANCRDIFSSFTQGDEDEDENGKFLTNFWKDMPVKPQAKSMTQPDKDCSFQIPRSSGSDNSATKKDTKATVGPPNKASQILGHIMDNWKPGEKIFDTSQIVDCVNN